MGKKSKMIVYPNPVTGNSIHLQLGNASAGIYKVRLLNYIGQEVFKAELKHIAGIPIEFISLNKNIAEGSYRLEIIAADGTKTNIPIAILK